MSDERIKQKIRKLLELGRRSQFPHEAKVASDQALTLMRRHNLTERDLYSTKPIAKVQELSEVQSYVDQLVELLKYKKLFEEYSKEQIKIERKKKLIILLVSFLIVLMGVGLGVIIYFKG